MDRWASSSPRPPVREQSERLRRVGVVKLLVALARRAHIDVEVINFGADALANQVRQLQRIHAANFGAPSVGVVIARADAVNNADHLWFGAAAQHDLTTRRTGGIDQTS